MATIDLVRHAEPDITIHDDFFAATDQRWSAANSAVG